MGEKKKIFIADDDKVNLESLKKLLLLSGFDVDTADNPKAIVPKIKVFKPDLILLDLLMPNLGGLEVCEMLNNDRQTQDIPIIILSALTNPADIKKAYHLGVVGYLTKPYELDALLKEINKAITYKEGKGF